MMEGDIVLVGLALLIFGLAIIFVFFKYMHKGGNPNMTSAMVRPRGWLLDRRIPGGWAEIVGSEYINRDTFALVLKNAEISIKQVYHRMEIEPLNVLGNLAGSGAPTWVAVGTKNYMEQGNKQKEMIDMVVKQQEKVSEAITRSKEQILETDERTQQVIDGVVSLKKADRSSKGVV